MGSKNMFSAAYASRQAEQEDMQKALNILGVNTNG